jgi:hypothetical protein
MSIPEVTEKIKSFWSAQVRPVISQIRENFDLKEDTFIIFVIILVGLAGFGLGRLSALEKSRGEVQIIRPNSPTDNLEKAGIVSQSASAMIAGESAKGFLVASKSGRKYHFPWCAGASQIAEKNKIWFSSYAEAKSAGYTPASNCKGLE